MIGSWAPPLELPWGPQYYGGNVNGKKGSDSDSSKGSKCKGNKGKNGSDVGKPAWNYLGPPMFSSGRFAEGEFGKGGKGKKGKQLCFWAYWREGCEVFAKRIWKGKSRKAKPLHLCSVCYESHKLQSAESHSNHPEHYEQKGVEWDGAEADKQASHLELYRQWQSQQCDPNDLHREHWQRGQAGKQDGWQCGETAAEWSRPRWS